MIHIAGRLGYEFGQFAFERQARRQDGVRQFKLQAGVDIGHEGVEIVAFEQDEPFRMLFRKLRNPLAWDLLAPKPPENPALETAGIGKQRLDHRHDALVAARVTDHDQPTLTRELTELCGHALTQFAQLFLGIADVGEEVVAVQLDDLGPIAQKLI